MGNVQRKKRRENKRKKTVSKAKSIISEPVEKKKESFYDKNYKLLIIIPALLLLLAIILISTKMATTGEFMNKGITLSGGVSVTILKEGINKEALLEELQTELPNYQVNIRGLEDGGRRIGIFAESNLPPENEELANKFKQILKDGTGAEEKDISTETIGSSLGAAFFKQTLLALLFAFIFMGVVIFLYFKDFIPSLLTIISALSDIIITLAIINLLGINIGTAGIAAFLMLIGYSVDANIVLNMRVLKRKTGTIVGQIRSAMGTGLTMSLTTLTAITVAFFVADSPVLKEIMLILIIGLLVDVLNTWIQNAGLLRWYLEKEEAKKQK